ncbi:MAG TPA: ABC transporter ATP-binding protein [Solirubrobacteraceae bacterium]|jgi:branched-chain amino acid transport system ATP-binding protein|nr:ABC transporter ATP-binding protein [Solirubrobacteraceae bacterium]
MRLDISGLDASYGSSQVLFGLDMHVEDGETVALIGRNGAGKTTTLHCVMGVIGARSGSILLDERQTIGLGAHRIARLGVGLVPQGRRIFTDLTVEENLRTGIRPDSPRADASGRLWTMDELLEVFPLLAKVRKSKGGWLSGGEQQVLSIARALISSPGILLLDEPTEGLAPRVVETLTEQLLRIKDAGLTMLLAEQHVGLVGELASRAYVIDRGLVRVEGEPASLLSDAEIRRAYLSL